MTVNAPAKINIALDITGKRPDGYHELLMIMHEIPLYDTVTVEHDSKISVSGNKPDIPYNEKNIAYKAAAEFFAYTKISGGAKIYLEKNIPDGAGLGGGSSDGAAVIKSLNKLYGACLSAEEMRDIAVKIGADVPFFITGGTCIAQGIGEKLTPISPLAPCFILLVKPNFSISTADAYKKADTAGTFPHASVYDIAENISDIKYVGKNMFNVLELAADSAEIRELKDIMTANGACGAMMTGSGSCVFGLFETEEGAKKCVEKIKFFENSAILRNF